MFLADTHMPQLIAPPDYTSASPFERERERLFLPAWHCIGALSDVPREGDYFTTNIFGYPLIVWRAEGRVQAFLNVCAHRYCTLSDAPRGHCGERLRCQYHGWEYNADGDTRKIPDAKNFKPLAPGELGLKKFRTELMEQLIFVTLSDDAPPLAEYLGPLYDQWRPMFAAQWWSAAGMDYEVAANWKIITENALESYHTDAVHPNTFGSMPREETCSHEIDELHATFSTGLGERPLDIWLNGLMHRLTGLEPHHRFTHVIRFPNLMFGRLGVWSWVEETYPISPTQSRRFTRGFCHGGPPGNLRGKIVTKLVRRSLGRLMGRVNAEDDRVVAEIQRGLSSPEHPSGGMISVREERVYHFQKFVQAAMAH